MKKIFLNVGMVFLFLSLHLWSYSQKLDEAIPFPKNVVKGELANGLDYIIFPNDIPEKKLEFRLVINMGSIVEDDSQKGMAHFLEHMAFNGGEHFDGKGIVESLRKIGVKFGFGLNAFTGYDKTIYILPIPTDKPENIEMGLNIIKEWMCYLKIDKQEVLDEKGVILQEIKDHEQMDQFYDLKLKDTKYKNRLPIGDNNDIARINNLNLKEFYNTWYRPNLMTIVAVGDVDVKELEQKIIKKFKSVQNPNLARLREKYTLPTYGGFQFQVAKDEYLKDEKIEMIFPNQFYPIQTYGDLRTKLINSLFTDLLCQRIRNKKDVNALYSNGWYLTDKKHAVFELKTSKEKDVYKTVDGLGKMLAQIKQHGFTKAEIADSKKTLIERLVEKNYTHNSASWADYFVDYATTKEKYVSNSVKANYYKKEIETITEKEILKNLNIFFTKGVRCLFTYQYNPKNVGDLDESKVIATWENALVSKTKKFKYTPKKVEEKKVVVKEFELPVLKKKRIKSEIAHKNIGVTEFVLENGLRVALKPCVANDEEINVSYFSRGGLALADESQIPLLEGTAAYADMGGVGNLSYDELGEVMVEKEINISTTIGEYFHGLYGAALTGNIEELMKMFYLKITAPQINKADFDEVLKGELESFGEESILLKRLNADPSRVLQKKISTFAGDIFKCGTEFKSKEDIINAKIEDVQSFYNKLYANANGKTLIVTGNFEIEKVKNLVCTYFGNLPNKGKPEAPKFLGNNYPAKVHKEDILDEGIDRTYITYMFPGENAHSLKTSLIYKITRDVIQHMLLKNFREEKGMVYSPFVTVNYKAYPKARYHFQVEYSSDPKNVDYLEKELFKQIENFKENGISQEELDKIVQSFVVTKRDVLTHDNYAQWRKTLKEMYLECDNVSEFNDYENIIRSITTEDIKNAFKTYFNKDRFVGFYIKDKNK
jgi:zinc protease